MLCWSTDHISLPPSLSVASLAPSLLVVDVSEDLEVDEDWVLSGQTKLPSPRIRINEAALPVNGNYLEYHATGVLVPVGGLSLQCLFPIHFLFHSRFITPTNTSH